MPELVFPKIQENNQEINEKKMSVEEKLKNDKNFKQLNKSIELVKNKNVYIAILGAIERFKKEKNSEYKKIAENLKNREDFSKFVEDLERKAEKSSRRKNSLDSFNQAEKDLNAMVELVNAGFLHVLFVHEFCLKVDKIYPDNDVVKEFLHKYCKKDMKDALKNAKLLLDFVSKKDDKKSTLMSYLSSGCTVKSDDVIEPSSKKPSKKN
ncbi:hypothetical protein ACQ4LE_000132 [Meloidogyne hapla]|uniref:Uncharacterized protein n=1 Tax=Meloidogyne hapla TaxID=6305 RepID=A0A1I8BRQ1_MELHA